MGKLGNGKLINEHEYGEVRYYNEYHDDDFDLTTTSDTSGGESHKDSVPQENNIRYLWKIYKHLLVPSLFAKF